jgi:hypothetical protein
MLHVIEKMPLLGTGKIDIPAVERMFPLVVCAPADEFAD